MVLSRNTFTAHKADVIVKFYNEKWFDRQQKALLPIKAWVIPWRLVNGGWVLPTVPLPASSILLKPCCFTDEPTQRSTCQPLNAPADGSI